MENSEGHMALELQPEGQKPGCGVCILETGRAWHRRPQCPCEEAAAEGGALDPHLHSCCEAGPPSPGEPMSVTSLGGAALVARASLWVWKGTPGLDTTALQGKGQARAHLQAHPDLGTRLAAES